MFYTIYTKNSQRQYLGDWLNYGEPRYGEMHSQALESTDYEYQTLKDFKWVADKIKLSHNFDPFQFIKVRTLTLTTCVRFPFLKRRL